MKLSKVKISSRIYSTSAFLILKRFDGHQRSTRPITVFIATFFVASCKTGGAKPKTGGAITGGAIAPLAPT